MGSIWARIREWMAERVVDVFFILWQWRAAKEVAAPHISPSRRLKHPADQSARVRR